MKMKSREESIEYWRNPVDGNAPLQYLKSPSGKRRSRFLTNIFEKYVVDKNAKIAELGCNVGRNLWFLWKAGYYNLTGIEINKAALSLMKSALPKMKVNTISGSIEDKIKELPEQDVIFTMAVLMHIHRDSEWVFQRISERARMIITLEAEVGEGTRYIGRNYGKVFGDIGMEQIAVYDRKISGLSRKYICRVMSWS